VIVIKGSTNAIASAKKLVDEVFSRATVNGGGGGGGGGVAGEVSRTASLGSGQEAGRMASIVIGKAGATVRALQQETGANIQISSERDYTDRRIGE
jgi:hypothetical protein